MFNLKILNSAKLSDWSEGRIKLFFRQARSPKIYFQCTLVQEATGGCVPSENQGVKKRTREQASALPPGG